LALSRCRAPRRKQARKRVAVVVTSGRSSPAGVTCHPVGAGPGLGESPAGRGPAG
jgi:hypothetical protein